MNHELAGRGAERSELWTAVQDGQHLLLTGPAGVGKTRLAREVLAQAEDAGWSTQLISATPAVQPVSFGAVHDLVSTEDLDGVALLNTAMDTLAKRANGRRQLVVADDIDKLDADSLALVDRLARDGTTTVLATVRSAGLSDPRVRPLWKDEVLAVVTIDPLGREATDALVSVTLAGDVDEALLSDVWNMTEGNPLFIRELLLGALRQGSVKLEAGRWVAVDHLAATNRLFGIISDRLAGLSPAERDGLIIVACSEPIPLAALTRVVENTALEALEDERFIQIEGVGGGRTAARMAHPMIGEVLRDGVGKVVRRRLLGQLACTMLETPGHIDPDNRQRALLWALDASIDFDHDLLLPAAERALFRFDADTAAKLAEPALDFVPSSRAAQILARSLALTNRHDSAATAARRGMPLAETELQRCDLLIVWADNEMHGRADPASGIAQLRRELPTFEDPEARAEILMRITVGFALMGELLETIETADEHIAGDGLPTPARVHVLSGVVYALLMTGKVDDTFRQRAADGLAITEAEPEFWIHDLLLKLLRRLGDVQDGKVQAALNATEARASAALDAVEVGGWQTVAAIAAVVTGDGRTTAATGVAAAQSVAASDPYGVSLWVEGIAATGFARQGDHDQAEAWIERGRANSQSTQGRLSNWLGTAEGWQLYRSGAEEEGRSRVLAAALAAAEADHFFHAAVAAHEVVRMGGAAEVVDHLREWAAIGQGSMTELYACHAEAQVAGDAAGLANVGQQFWDMGAPALAAEALAAAAVLCPDPAEARLLLTRAQTAARSVDWDDSPTLHKAAFPLSAREFEVAHAAASGKSNKEIAADLFLSFRTVGNHLQTVYRKLEISAREDLGNFFLQEAGT